MEKWTIKIKTLMAGPGGVVEAGTVYEEYANVAEELVKSGQAELISKPQKIEEIKEELKEYQIETAMINHRKNIAEIKINKAYNKKK